MFHQHGPTARGLTSSELRAHRKVTQLYHFSLVVCRHPDTGKYLLCQGKRVVVIFIVIVIVVFVTCYVCRACCLYPEFSSQGFWLPGGAVDAGETFSVAAHRECMEEAGVDIVLKGILSVEMHPFPPQHHDDTHLVRQRIVFYAEPTPEFVSEKRYPKSIPDFESCGACWVSKVDMEAGLKLRGSEPLDWARLVTDRPFIAIAMIYC